MSGVSTPRHEPIPIGEVAEPPFVQLPDPSTLFATRAARFRTLAESHQLAPYLNFLADLSTAQHEVQQGLPAPEMPAADALARAKDHGMPPLDRGKFTADAAFESMRSTPDGSVCAASCSSRSSATSSTRGSALMLARRAAGMRAAKPRGTAARRRSHTHR